MEENTRLKLQVFRFGEVLLASCACEPQVDLMLNLESRAERRRRQHLRGYDWAARARRPGDGAATAHGPRGDGGGVDRMRH